MIHSYRVPQMWDSSFPFREKLCEIRLILTVSFFFLFLHSALLPSRKTEFFLDQFNATFRERWKESNLPSDNFIPREKSRREIILKLFPRWITLVTQELFHLCKSARYRAALKRGPIQPRGIKDKYGNITGDLGPERLFPL